MPRKPSISITLPVILPAAALLLLVGGLLAHRLLSSPSFPLPLPPSLSRSILQQQQQQCSEVPADDPVLARLEQALGERNRAELAALQGQQGAQPLMVQAARSSQRLMADLLARHGATHYRQRAVCLAGQTAGALLEGLAAARGSGGIKRFIEGLEQDDPRRRQLIERYGSFLLAVAVPAGLVGQDGTSDRDLETYVRVLVLHRLLLEPARMLKLEPPLTEGERRVLLRFRVERADDSSQQIRLRSLTELSQIEADYPQQAARVFIVGE